MRRTISERLKRSISTAVSLTLTREVRADVLVRSRTALTTAVGRKLSWDALFIKLLGLALREHPELNATVEDDAVLSWEDINIGFAVAVPGGLQVPVVHNADTKTLVAISSAVTELGRRAVDGSLQPEEVLGGTATITNLGGFGVDAFTPVLNPPQSVILGIGRIMERPVVESGVIVPAKNLCAQPHIRSSRRRWSSSRAAAGAPIRNDDGRRISAGSELRRRRDANSCGDLTMNQNPIELPK